jgi:predicted phosphodiesterase
MKTAIFSDVHANELALDTFLEFARPRVEGFVCLGDTVGYGPKSNECIEKILELPNLITVLGNHEEMFLKRIPIELELPLVQQFYEISSRDFRFAEYLTTIPKSSPFERFTCTHTLENRNIYPDSKVEVQENYLIGHSHHQYILNSNIYKVINPGSVGQNRREIDKVDFAIYDHSDSSFEFYSLTYDVDLFIQQLRDFGYSDLCVNYYLGKKS